MSAQKEFLDAILKFRDDPVLYVRTMFKTEPQKHQADALRALARGDRKISIRSGRRVGKTTLMSWMALWFEMTRTDARTIVTAPSSAQLEDAFIPNFRQWVQLLPPVLYDMWDVKAQRFDFRMEEQQGFENFVTVRTARKDSPESLQGINARNVLVLVDEAAGVDDINFEALSGSLGTEHGHMVLTGNPNRASGYFYETHNRLSDSWTNIHVNSETCDLVSKDWVQEMEMRWGRDSNAFRIHVLGEFPLSDEDVLIPMHLVEAAAERDVKPSGPIVWGLDVAALGRDSTALCKRQGNAVLEPVKSWNQLDTMQTVGRVKAEWDVTPSHMRPFDILVDSIGIGRGVADRLREIELPARAINVSEAPSMKGEHPTLKVELWWKVREWFESREVSIPRDDRLMRELGTIRVDYTSSGKLRILDKDGKSPDYADSLMLSFASNAATAMHGRRRRGIGIKRNIRGVV